MSTYDQHQHPDHHPLTALNKRTLLGGHELTDHARRPIRTLDKGELGGDGTLLQNLSAWEGEWGGGAGTVTAGGGRVRERSREWSREEQHGGGRQGCARAGSHGGRVVMVMVMVMADMDDEERREIREMLPSFPAERTAPQDGQ